MTTVMPTLFTMAMSATVVLLEDHPLYREGLKSFISESFPSLKFLYDGGDFLAAKNSLEKGKPDLAIVDLHLGDGRAPSEIVSLFSSKGIPVLVISALNNFESVKSAFSMGAIGFVSKDSSIADIGKAIQAALAGREWISPILGRALAQTSSSADSLSAQEKKAIILYASGLKLEVVARRMEVAPSTAKQYIDRAKAKFRAGGNPVSSKTDIYKLLRSLNMID